MPWHSLGTWALGTRCSQIAHSWREGKSACPQSGWLRLSALPTSPRPAQRRHLRPTCRQCAGCDSNGTGRDGTGRAQAAHHDSSRLIGSGSHGVRGRLPCNSTTSPSRPHRLGPDGDSRSPCPQLRCDVWQGNVSLSLAQSRVITFN